MFLPECTQKNKRNISLPCPQLVCSNMRCTGPLQSISATRNNANIRNNCIQKQIAFDFFKRRGGVNVKSIFGITVVRYKEAFGTSKSQVSRNMPQISEQTMFFCICVSACFFLFFTCSPFFSLFKCYPQAFECFSTHVAND